jgi:hypothetical protein
VFVMSSTDDEAARKQWGMSWDEVRRERQYRDTLLAHIKDLEHSLHWEDVKDEWSASIKAAHPMNTNTHELYAKAMKMVGHRHSKGELVALVHWLLFEIAKGGKHGKV